MRKSMLAAICAERHDSQKTWTHLKNCEIIVKNRNHLPHALKQLKRELIQCCPGNEDKASHRAKDLEKERIDLSF